MLKKINLLLLSTALISVMACSPTGAPNTTTDGKTPGSTTDANITVGSVTKAQYLALLNCSIAKSDASADAKLGFENIKASVNAIPDAQWNIIAGANPAFSTQLQLALQNGCSI